MTGSCFSPFFHVSSAALRHILFKRTRTRPRARDTAPPPETRLVRRVANRSHSPRRAASPRVLCRRIMTSLAVITTNSPHRWFIPKAYLVSSRVEMRLINMSGALHARNRASFLWETKEEQSALPRSKVFSLVSRLECLLVGELWFKVRVRRAGVYGAARKTRFQVPRFRALIYDIVRFPRKINSRSGVRGTVYSPRKSS